ncbi:flavodoxin family protein [Enterococcus sp. HY326]|uniref:flavodoxin family protein n=1 Tax=Enterococcus sp. HY326 TaxID=2971265 RepID=UPI0022402560|nr:flavodoxin domain-containing protein [Enterococcus sp. HY326]
MKLAIIYYSHGGHTKKMAECIAQGMSVSPVEVRLFSLDEELDVAYLNDCAGIIFGTPTYLATAHWRVLEWLTTNHSVKLAGKLGGCFATAHYAQGGSDSAIMSLAGILLTKGMLVYSGGSALGKPFIHHGPVALDAVGNHFEEAQEMFTIFGERFVEKALELF